MISFIEKRLGSGKEALDLPLNLRVRIRIRVREPVTSEAAGGAPGGNVEGRSPGMSGSSTPGMRLRVRDGVDRVDVRWGVESRAESSLEPPRSKFSSNGL